MHDPRAVAASSKILEFAKAARSLSHTAKLRGLEVPTFRSPPCLLGVQRSIRWSGTDATISVVLRGRPWQAVLSDMIEGVLIANRLTSVEADCFRSVFWQAVADLDVAA